MVCDRVLAAREEGVLLREQAVLMRTGHDTRPARARARPAADPVRQVRRPALPRGRARQGLPRAAAPRRQPGRRDDAGSACCSSLDGVGPARARRAVDALAGRPEAVRGAALGRPLPPRRRARELADAVLAALDARARVEPRAGTARPSVLPRARSTPLVRAHYPDARGAPPGPRRAGRRGRRGERPDDVRRPSCCSTRRRRRRTWRARRCSTTTGSCSARCTAPRASSGRRCTCSRRTTGTSRRACRRASRRRSPRSGACSTSRSPARGASLHVYVPVRFHHRPHRPRRRARLRPPVALPHRRGAVAVRRDADRLRRGPGVRRGRRAERRIEVSVDELFA